MWPMGNGYISVSAQSKCVLSEERRLPLKELPLRIQLNWGQDDREGRFLLKNEDDKTIPVCNVLTQNAK